MCFFRWSRRPNRLPQVWHGNGRCPVWIRLCLVNSSFLVKVLPQFDSSHLNGLSPTRKKTTKFIVINLFKAEKFETISIIFFSKTTSMRLILFELKLTSMNTNMSFKLAIIRESNIAMGALKFFWSLFSGCHHFNLSFFS